MHPVSESWSKTYATRQKLFFWFLPQVLLMLLGVANLQGWWHFPALCHVGQIIFANAMPWRSSLISMLPCTKCRKVFFTCTWSFSKMHWLEPKKSNPWKARFSDAISHVMQQKAFSHSSCQLAFCTLVKRCSSFSTKCGSCCIHIGKGHWMQTSLPIKSRSHGPQDKCFPKFTVSWGFIYVSSFSNRCESKVV